MLYQPELPQPKEILDVVSIPPIGPFNKIHQGRFNYLTDLIFHEVGHIEHRRLENWQEGEAPVKDFPSDEQKEKFLSVIRQTEIFPDWITDLIIQSINRAAIEEMYAMLIDREAARLYDIQSFDTKNRQFEEVLTGVQNEPPSQELVEHYKRLLKDRHVTGSLLVRILEEQFPDFGERKKFVRLILERTSERKF